MLLYWLTILMATIVPSETRILFDLSDPRESATWQTVDDVVMGGISDSDWAWSEDGISIFSGKVSLENNGGFCSVRSVFFESNLVEYVGIEFVVKGDGKTYTFYVRDDFGNVLHSRAVKTTGDWQIIRLPFALLQARRFGIYLPNAPRLDTTLIRMVGIIITDKQVGDFRLEVEQVGVYR